MIKVLIADDHDIVRQGLKVLLTKKAQDIEVVIEATDGEEVLDNLDKEIDVFLIDIEMPEYDGIEVARKIKERCPESKLIMYSTYSSKRVIEKAIEVGIDGYILKEDSVKNLVNAIHNVYEGQTYYSQRIANIVVNSFVDRKLRRGKDNKDLTQRELEVLGLIVEGFSKEEISEKLGISVNTVNIHRKNIMGKLEIHNAIELTKYAIKEGIVEI